MSILRKGEVGHGHSHGLSSDETKENDPSQSQNGEKKKPQWNSITPLLVGDVMHNFVDGIETDSIQNFKFKFERLDFQPYFNIISTQNYTKVLNDKKINWDYPSRLTTSGYQGMMKTLAVK